MDVADYSEWSRDDLVREITRLQALIEGRFKDARLLGMAPDGKGAFVLDIQTGLSGVMAENMLAILQGEGAPNFVQVEASHPQHGPLTFTVERRLGRAPAAQLAQMKAVLREIADGKGECSMCGKVAVGEGEGGGVIDCDCERGAWQPRDPQAVARRALAANQCGE